MFFYRDRSGGEIDVILESGDALVAVEAKSGETVAEDFFPPLEWFDQALWGIRRRPRSEKVLVYSGDTSATRRATRVVAWGRVAEFDWTSRSDAEKQ